MGSMPQDEDEEDEECGRPSSKLMVVDGKNNSSSSKLNLVSTSQSKIYRSGIQFLLHKCINMRTRMRRYQGVLILE